MTREGREAGRQGGEGRETTTDGEVAGAKDRLRDAHLKQIKRCEHSFRLHILQPEIRRNRGAEET